MALSFGAALKDERSYRSHMFIVLNWHLATVRLTHLVLESFCLI